MLQAPDDDFQIDLPFISLNSRNRSEKESWKPSTLLIVKNKICSNTHASLTGVLLCYFQFTVLFFQQLLWHARKLFHKRSDSDRCDEHMGLQLNSLYFLNHWTVHDLYP